MTEEAAAFLACCGSTDGSHLLACPTVHATCDHGEGRCVWPCRSCGMSLRDCTEEPDPLGVCCAVCGQAARGNHGEYEWQPSKPAKASEVRDA